MAETAAHLVEHVLPERPIRQWVLSFPYPLRFLFATRPAVLTQVLGIVYRAISTFLVRRAGLRSDTGARTGTVTLIQRFGSALNLNPHLHMLFVDGAYAFDTAVFVGPKSPHLERDSPALAPTSNPTTTGPILRNHGNRRVILPILRRFRASIVSWCAPKDATV